jgi:hypothetical protein
VRDRDDRTATPLDQGESEGDRNITQHIRKGVVANDALSTNARNVKIVTQDGVVTLRGPVNSAQEKSAVIALAQAAPGVKRRLTNPHKETRMTKAVFCIARTEDQARNIVTELKDAGFHGSDISVLFPDTGGSRDFAHEQQTKAPEGAATGAASGGALGGVVGWLAGIGTLAIPGVGPLIAAGPILAALSGAAAGATIGGLTGALVGYGIPEYEAKRYEGKVRDGNILISVHTEDRQQRAVAKDIFDRCGAEDVGTAGEASPPSA